MPVRLSILASRGQPNRTPSSLLKLCCQFLAIRLHGDRHRFAVVAKPICRQFEAAQDPLPSERQVNPTAELVSDEVANRVRPKTRLARCGDGRATKLSPFERKG